MSNAYDILKGHDEFMRGMYKDREFKGTPGPWVAVFNNVFWEICPENRQETDPYTIGDVCASDPKNPGSGLQEANANLIAAAPDLLEALQILLQSVEGNHVTVGDCNQAQSAIAKALGQNNG